MCFDLEFVFSVFEGSQFIAGFGILFGSALFPASCQSGPTAPNPVSALRVPSGLAIVARSLSSMGAFLVGLVLYLIYCVFASKAALPLRSSICSKVGGWSSWYGIFCSVL